MPPPVAVSSACCDHEVPLRANTYAALARRGIRHADHGAIAGDIDREAEQIAVRARCRQEFGLLRPAARIAHEHIRRAVRIAAERGGVLEWRADQQRIRVERNAAAERVERDGIRGGEARFLCPRRTAANENIHGARADAGLIGADREPIARKRCGKTEALAAGAAARRELGLLRPAGTVADKDIRRARLGTGRGGDERVARYVDGGSECGAGDDIGGSDAQRRRAWQRRAIDGVHGSCDGIFARCADRELGAIDTHGVCHFGAGCWRRAGQDRGFDGGGGTRCRDGRNEHGPFAHARRGSATIRAGTTFHVHD